MSGKPRHASSPWRWRRITISRWFKALFVLLVVSLRNFTSSAVDDSAICESIVRNWAESATDKDLGVDKLSLKDLLFFLHIPRTGGRTYFQCFLRKLYTSEQECPRSYDKLRFNPSKTNCCLVATHDDYSLLSKLSKQQTSVVTILRNPIDRVFSTYEFSVEVAARFLVHPNLTSVTRMSMRLRPKSHQVSTLDIWPWKYLVPWMREDLFARRDARKHKGIAEVEETGDPYNVEEIAMPLLHFINDPISHDIIHNGATFQLAGLTNNSCLAEAHKIRHCVRRHPTLGRYILELAKKRLDNMLYVGLTEDHRKSAALFATMVGSQVLSQSESSTSYMQKHTSKSELFSSLPSSMSGSSIKSNSSVIGSPASEAHPMKDKTVNESMIAEKLMEAYEGCVFNLRKSQSHRRIMSLKRITPVKFSKEARKLVPKTILQQVLMLNSLDVELYKYAQDIFKQQLKHLRQSIMFNQRDVNSAVHQMYVPSQNAWSLKHERDGSKDGIFHGYSSWNVLFVAAGVGFLVLLYLFMTGRRQTSKLKV